jgi:hypothetical protein
MTTAIRIPTMPPDESVTLDPWRRRSTMPVGLAIDAHLDKVLGQQPVAPVTPVAPEAAPSGAGRTRTPRRWLPFEPMEERVAPTYLAFESPERLTEYLRARSMLAADRTRT